MRLLLLLFITAAPPASADVSADTGTPMMGEEETAAVEEEPAAVEEEPAAVEEEPKGEESRGREDFAGDIPGGSGDDDDVANDPLEYFNRAIFAFNEQLDRYLLKPLAQGWDDIPDEITDRAHNLLANLDKPVSAVNYVLQADRQGVGNALAGLLLNVVIGLGMFDVASAVGVGEAKTDLGITLGKWGIGDGPYLVLPLLGPSPPRDLAGAVGDAYFSPSNLAVRNKKITFFEYASSQTTKVVDERASILQSLSSLKASSLDFYAAVRAVYRQKRAAQIGGEELGLGWESAENQELINLLDALEWK